MRNAIPSSRFPLAAFRAAFAALALAACLFPLALSAQESRPLPVDRATGKVLVAVEFSNNVAITGAGSFSVTVPMTVTAPLVVTGPFSATGGMTTAGPLTVGEALALGAAAELTITGGELTPTVPVIAAQPQTLTADDLTTVHASYVGQTLWLVVADPATDVIVVRHGVGNLSLPAGQDITLTHGALQLVSQADGSWRASGGGGGGGGSAIDDPGGAATGDLLTYGASAPEWLTPGTAGYVLSSAGAGNALAWSPYPVWLPTALGTGDYVLTSNGSTGQWSPVSATSIAATAITYSATETIPANVGYAYPDAYTVLQMHFDDNVTDFSESAHTPAWALTQSPEYAAAATGFGQGARVKRLNTYPIDEDVGKIETEDSAAFDFGGGDFTIEARFKKEYTISSYPFALLERTNGAWPVDTQGGWSMRVDTNQKANFIFRQGGTTLVSLLSSSLSNNTWYHIAVSRSGSTWSLYVNGAIAATATVADAISNLSTVAYSGYGQATVANGEINICHIDELRVSKGVARYTGAFTAPSAPFDDDSYRAQEIPLTTGAQALLASPEVSAAGTGSLLVKSTEWTPLTPGAAGYTLTSTGTGSAPQWSPARYAPMWDNWSIDQYNGSLAAYWPLSETSGTRYDLMRSTALADGNTVGWTSGVGGTGGAALFTAANSEYLVGKMPFAATDTTRLACSFWIKPTALPSSGNAMGIVTMGAGALYQTCGIYLYNDAGTTTIRFNVRSSAGDTYITGPSPVVGTWYHVGFYVDLANSLMIGYVNGTATSTATPSGAMHSGESTDMVIGARYYSKTPSSYLDGAIQALDIRPGMEFADATEREAFFTALYNGGTPAAME